MKQKFSGFQGIATQYRDNPGNSTAVIIGAADVYRSDFGLHSIIAEPVHVPCRRRPR